MTKKKTLLEEGTVRQFMKLANLKPLASDFVESLYEKKNPYGGEKDGREHDAPQDEHEDKETEEQEDKADYEDPTSKKGKERKKKAEKARKDEGFLGTVGGGLAGLASPIPGGAALGAAAGSAAQDAMTGQRDDDEFEIEDDVEVEEEGGEVDIQRLVTAITTAIEDETGVEISVSSDEEEGEGFEEEEVELEEPDDLGGDEVEVGAEEEFGDIEEMVTTIAENVTRRLHRMASRKKKK